MKKLALAAFVAYLIIATWWFISIARVSLAGTLPLFGNFRVLLVYCVASLPLCWCLASRCLGHVSGAKWIRVGVVGFISLVIGLILSRQPMQPDTTYLVRNVLRSICAVAMTMPAGMLFSAMQSKPNSLRRHSSFSQQLILSLLGAAILPALYVQNQVAAVRSTFMLQSVEAASFKNSYLRLSIWNCMATISWESVACLLTQGPPAKLQGSSSAGGQAA